MKYTILFLAVLVGVALAHPHHHEQGEGVHEEEPENGGDKSLHHHHHDHQDGEEVKDHDHHHHHHGDNELKKSDYHSHHHSAKWDKYKSDWKEFRAQMSEMAEDMEEVKKDVKALKEDTIKVTKEEATALLGIEKEVNGKHMKIVHESKMLVKMVSSDGTVSNKSMPSNSAIITLQMHKSNVKHVWHRIKGSDTGIYWHSGACLMIHIVTADGAHKKIMLGDTLKHEEAVYSVYVPGNAFFTKEPMNETDPEAYTVVSYACVPSWSYDNHIKLPMEEKEDGSGMSFLPTQAVLDNLKDYPIEQDV